MAKKKDKKSKDEMQSTQEPAPEAAVEAIKANPERYNAAGRLKNDFYLEELGSCSYP